MVLAAASVATNSWVDIVYKDLQWLASNSFLFSEMVGKSFAQWCSLLVADPERLKQSIKKAFSKKAINKPHSWEMYAMKKSCSWDVE